MMVPRHLIDIYPEWENCERWPSQAPDDRGSVSSVGLDITGVGGDLASAISTQLRLNELQQQVQELKNTICAVSTFIASLGVDSIQVTRPIPVAIYPDGEEFVATFFDANINASGETVIEAFENLKDMIAASYRLFCRQKEHLGTEPARQLAVLKTHIEG